MVRCVEFYEKWEKAGNFCEKHPETARRIDKYLNEIIEVEEAIKEEKPHFANGPEGTPPKGREIVAEKALRPLFSEKSPEVRKKVIKQIVKKADEKFTSGKKPRVTSNEVKQILAEVKGPFPSNPPIQKTDSLPGVAEEESNNPEPIKEECHSPEVIQEESSNPEPIKEECHSPEVVKEIHKREFTGEEAMLPPLFKVPLIEKMAAQIKAERRDPTKEEWAIMEKEYKKAWAEHKKDPFIIARADLFDNSNHLRALLMVPAHCPVCDKEHRGELVWSCCNTTLRESARIAAEKHRKAVNASMKIWREKHERMEKREDSQAKPDPQDKSYSS